MTHFILPRSASDMAFQTTLSRYNFEKLTSTPQNQVVSTSSGSIPASTTTKTELGVEHEPPYQDLGRLETTQLGKDDIKYDLLIKSWESVSKLRFPSR